MVLSAVSRVNRPILFPEYRIEEINVYTTVTLLTRKCNRAFSLISFSDGCAMVDNWDTEEPQNKNKGNSLCRKLFGKGDDITKEPDPYPFKRLFRNDEYCVLKV